MKTEKEISRFSMAQIEDILNSFRTVLENAGYENKRIIRYIFALEESLCVWKSCFPSDSVLLLEKSERKEMIEFEVKLDGQKCNPLKSDDAADEYSNTKNRILAGCGVEFRYFFHKGTNELKFVLPKKNIEKRLLIKNYLALVFPLVIQSIIFSAITATDGFMLGFISQDALSAVSVVNSFVLIYTAFFDVIVLGLGILSAQLWGNGDKKSLADVLSVSFKYGFIISVAFFLISIFFSEAVVSLYTNDPNLINKGASYLKTVSVAFLLSGITQIYGCIMTNTGRASKMMLISMLSSILNLVLNAILIFGLFGLPKLEIKGAAIATIIAEFVGAAISIAILINDGMLGDILKLSFNYKSKYTVVLSKLCGVAFLQRLSWEFANSVIASLFGHMGSNILAAKSLAFLVGNITVAFAVGIGQGAGVLIGNELGSKQYNTVKRQAPWILSISLIVGIGSIAFTLGLGSLAKLLPIDLTRLTAGLFLISSMLAEGTSRRTSRSPDSSAITALEASG